MVPDDKTTIQKTIGGFCAAGRLGTLETRNLVMVVGH